MESWIDQAIVLNARAHGEGGAIVSLLTEYNGRHAGYVHGGMSSKMRSSLQPGTLVKAEWSARVNENLGTLQIEAEQNLSPDILDHSLKLSSILSACALCHEGLPEREGHPGLYHGFLALKESMENELWGVSYVMWEISLLRELGFHLELDKCAAGGDPKTLTHMSPKSGRSVSSEKAEPYKDKLLILPNFLRLEEARDGESADLNDILLGLKMTLYFLEHWAFAHHTQGLPQARLLFQERFESKIE
ncbi:MAG: DNA repair protein RecO [Pseudomonadota bacterium]